MTLNEYQKISFQTAAYPDHGGGNVLYPVMGLSGETGEVSEKVKKIWRNNGLKGHKEITEYIKANPEVRKALRKECGDCLWYISGILTEIGEDLEAVAHENIAKLQDRASRDVIKSEGDTR